MNNKNFAVGLFVAVGLAVFVAGTLWLTGRQGSEPTTYYSMFFEKDVSGLMLGGPVFYLGVDVGTVTAMEIIPGNPMRVRVDAEVLKSTPINSGTFASLAFQGITGVAVIKLSADPGVYEYLSADTENGHPVIEVRDAGFSALLARAPGVVDRIDSLLLQVSEILGEENREFVSGILADLKTVTNALASNEQTISELPELLKETIEELQVNLEQIKAMLANMESPLSSTLTNLEQTTQNLAQMTARLDAWTEINDTDMNAFMGDGLGQVPALVTEARATIREVNKLMNDLRRDPSTLIYKPNEEAVEVER
ncbi:MAG: MCE family protein [Gammaproteobacteria bacterium]|nr:MCE family protein [Gammaproteobacteria bacterium]